MRIPLAPRLARAIAFTLAMVACRAQFTAAQDLQGKPVGVAVDIWANTPRCQIVYLLFPPATTFKGEAIKSFRLYRNARVVREVPAADVAKSKINGVLHFALADSRFEPATGLVNSYRVSVVTVQGQESPLSDPVSYKPTASLCAANRLKALVVVPALPAGVAAADVVSASRLEEVFVSGAASVTNYFKEVSTAKGEVTWGGPAITIWPQQTLPKSIAQYTANGTVSIDTTIPADLLPIKTSIQATNPALFADSRAVFVFVVMGAPAGGTTAASIIRVSGAGLLPGQPAHAGIGTIVHEVGHRLGLQHASSIAKTAAHPQCTSSAALPFGSDPLSSVRNCEVSTYDDRTDAMGAANVRPFSAYGRAWLFGHAPVKIAQSGAAKSRTVRLYASSFVGVSPLGWGGANAKDVWFRLDTLDPGGASYYVLEYRNTQGFSDTKLTGGTCAFPPGIYVHFRPGIALPPGDLGTSQTYIANNACATFSVTGAGETKTYDSASGFTVTLTKMTTDFADVTLSWK